jgi:hypothetical protein
MVFTYSAVQALGRVPFCAWCHLVELGGSIVRKHCYISLLPLPLHLFLYRWSADAII